MLASAVDTKTLPENAYQPLHGGKLYLPIVLASANLPELTGRSIAWGLLTATSSHIFHCTPTETNPVQRRGHASRSLKIRMPAYAARIQRTGIPRNSVVAGERGR
jgi:hypothetical protein